MTARREARPARQRLGLPDRRTATASTWSGPTPLLGERHRAHHPDERSAAASAPAAAARWPTTCSGYLVEHTRLGIPAIVHEEICSGLMAREATVFPQALGVAATFRPELNHALADAIRRQMRAIGAHQGLSPVLDVCRDPRWGRLEETYGEDPYLVSQMGLAFIRGLQGDDLARRRDRHRQALRRLRRIRGRHELGARAPARARAARRLPAPVRGGRPRWRRWRR